MKKSLFKFVGFILLIAMLISSFSSCGNESETTDETVSTATESETTSESKEETTNVKDTASEGTEDTEETEETETELKTEQYLEGEHADLIELTNDLANGVQAYFTDKNRTHYNLQNQEMTLNYARSNSTDQLVASITNTKGNPYIENTMDVFIRMADGSEFYASDSIKSANYNLYRFGYYFYEAIFEFQNFVTKNTGLLNETVINVQNFNKTRSNTVRGKKQEGDKISFVITDTADPFIVYDGFEINCADVDTLKFVVKAGEELKLGKIFLTTDKYPNYTEKCTINNYSLISDGEYDTYLYSLDNIIQENGKITSIRIDLDGQINEAITLSACSFGKRDISESVPEEISINRHFYVYSDKMHHAVQFATVAERTDIDEVGMLTKVAVSTVDKLLIKDGSGEHTTLDGIDWNTVECVGFDIKDTGIFGFIMPNDEVGGSIEVTEKDGYYVIEQTRAVPNGTLTPSVSGTANANDFYLGQRIYTDENHDFEEFLYETYCERNPIGTNQVRIVEKNSDSAEFTGYDAMRGVYVLQFSSRAEGFASFLRKFNRNFRIDFEIVAGKIDRDIYIMTSRANPSIECAALLDADLMMLPVPIEVIKNFSEASGDRNLFNLDDPVFSEAIFCLSLKSGEKYEYNILNLYQNWGKYPLKQLSQIPFGYPYYHLSTGVTETNCIVPNFLSGKDVGKKGNRFDTLPDHRAMSAPLWTNGDPQHTSGGSHSWLEYTDSEGNFNSVEVKHQTVLSYGPTYAEITWDNVSDDGKIAVTYTHLEMPQTDENRTYYTMEYTVLEDVTIKNFAKDFQFYGVTDNDQRGTYKRIGYLDENNEFAYAVANKSVGEEKIYKLGDKSPYFSYFDMPDYVYKQGYVNMAFMICSSEFVIGGEKVEPTFVIVNSLDHVRLSLDLEKVELKAGDKFTINAIVMPWGSQEYNGKYDDIINEQTGEKLLDKNVREVRENTILNPLTVTTETDEVIESAYLPRVRSADGKTAQFTLSGGENNVAVRVYGFNLLTSPKVEELVDGEWVEYVLDSSETPDETGYYHYYDGYAVYYDGDGTFSYSFVTTMTSGTSRTFRLSADEKFERYPVEIPPKANIDLLKVFADAKELADIAKNKQSIFGEITMGEDDKYVTLSGNGTSKEAYFSVYSSEGKVESGQYMVIKYHVPEENAEKLGSMQLWSSTTRTTAAEGDYTFFTPLSDGEWHVAVIDLTKTEIKTFTPDNDGKYYANYVRVDVFNKVTSPDTKIDIAFIGICASLEEICAITKDDFDIIELYENKNIIDLDTKTAAPYVKQYIDPESGYKKYEGLFAANSDIINGSKLVYTPNSNTGLSMIRDVTAPNGQIRVLGWCAVDVGIEKYVYSFDGGKTWLDVGGSYKNAGNDIVKEAAKNRLKIGEFDDPELAKTNGFFQAPGIILDLSSCYGETVDVTLAAVPVGAEDKLALLFSFEGVVVGATE